MKEILIEIAVVAKHAGVTLEEAEAMVEILSNAFTPTQMELERLSKAGKRANNVGAKFRKVLNDLQIEAETD